MMRQSRDREKLKERMGRWIQNNSVYGLESAYEVAILETFFYIYNGLEDGMSIQQIGSELGVLPFP